MELGQGPSEDTRIIARRHIPLFVAIVMLVVDDDHIQLGKGSKKSLACPNDHAGLTLMDTLPIFKKSTITQSAVQGDDVLFGPVGACSKTSRLDEGDFGYEDEGLSLSACAESLSEGLQSELGFA
jgi:hypothetical protein